MLRQAARHRDKAGTSPIGLKSGHSEKHLFEIETFCIFYFNFSQNASILIFLKLS